MKGFIMPTKNELYAQMKRVLDTAKAEGRDLTAAERSHFDTLEAEFDLQARNEGVIETRGGYGGHNEDHARKFTNYLRYGETQGLSEYRFSPMSTSPGAPAAGTTAAGYGGYLVPEGFWHNLQVALKAYGGLSSQFRQVDTETGNPTPWPTNDSTSIVGSLISENTQLTEVDFTFGQGMLSAWTITSGVHLVSIQTVEDSAFDIDAFIAARAGEAIGRKLAALAVSGSGSSQPLGIITALAAKGVTSGANGGYVQLGAATAVKNFSGSTTELISNTLAPQTLVTMVQSVDPAYYKTPDGEARWYMSAAQAFNFASVVDNNNRPLLSFLNGLDTDNIQSADYSSNSAVGRMLGFGVTIDNSLPALTASTVGGPVFGNLAHAMVQRNVTPGVHVMRLTERYADFLQVGYVSYLRTDIRSNDLRAAVTVNAAAT